MTKNKEYSRFSTLNKSIASLFFIALLLGYSTNYFLINFLKSYLSKFSLDLRLIEAIVNFYYLVSFIGILMFAFLLAVAFYFIFKKFIGNISLLKNSLLKARDLENYDVELKGKGEIGEILVFFKKIVDEMKEYKGRALARSDKLETVVDEKTRELQQVLKEIEEDKNDLQKQRSAILNILEDVQESQEELTVSKENLEHKHFELELLKTLSDKLTSAVDVDEVIVLVRDYLKKISQSSVITLMISNPLETGDMHFKSFLNFPVGEDYLKFVRNDMLQYMRKQIKSFDKASIGLLDKIMPGVDGKKMDNTNKTLPVKTMIAPIIAGGKTFGIIHLGYDEKKKNFAETEEDLIFALASTFSISVARLHAVDQYQHSKTESLIKGMNDGVIMFSREKNIVLTNPRATEYTGLSYISSSLSDFIVLFDDFKMRDKINGSLDAGLVSYIKEIRLLKKYYEIVVSPVKDSEGEIVGGSIIMHDITYIKEIDKMKTEFVSVASHQLRTPLTAIKLFTEMLIGQDVGKLNKEQKEYLDNVYNSTERMVRLVNDLLNVTRIESGRLRVSPQDVDFSEFIRDVITEAKPTAKMKNTIIKFKKANLPKIPLDQNLFRQVIQNMISNAIRYSLDDKGLVLIETKRDKEDFIISVRDNGIGIPKDMQKRIFQKFFRADNAIKAVTEGTGLGLYVSRMIVENSGGKIWFESLENKGTTFYVKMPLSGMKAIEGERGLAIS